MSWRRGALVAAAVLSVGCLSPPTEVLVVVNSNAPSSQLVSYRVWVHDGAESPSNRTDAAAQWQQLPGRNPDEGVSFTIIPKEGGPRDGTFTIRIEATSDGITVSRTHRGQFWRGKRQPLLLAINFDCGRETVGCRDRSIRCTVERLCEEQGRTCGPMATCIPIDLPTEPFDAGLDGATLVVPPRADASSADAFSTDAFSDVPTDTADDALAQDVAMDARVDSCTRNCAGRACGDDGCGGSCGTCPMGQSCNGMGQCVPTCTPNCAGRECGSDGCGGSCGTCAAPSTCNMGRCTCTPNCAGRECGSDGCGGSCGTCAAPSTCNMGRCTCTPSCSGSRSCGMPDGCGGRCTGCPSGLTCNPMTGACFCASGCLGSGSCRDRCGFANPTCASNCPSNTACNMSTGNCDCMMTCGTTCCPSGTLYCRGSTCCRGCGIPSAVCNLC
jgi:hypothetical protein